MENYPKKHTQTEVYIEEPKDRDFETAHNYMTGEEARKYAGIIEGLMVCDGEIPSPPSFDSFGGDFISFGLAMKEWTEKHHPERANPVEPKPAPPRNRSPKLSRQGLSRLGQLAADEPPAHVPRPR